MVNISVRLVIIVQPVRKVNVRGAHITQDHMPPIRTTVSHVRVDIDVQTLQHLMEGLFHVKLDFIVKQDHLIKENVPPDHIVLQSPFCLFHVQLVKTVLKMESVN